ncbi:hypothetical protein BATDEDRAFT_33937 [Batrachochytrium dendrobatidis JAM81]|uniref:Partial AB-hydrolase lipase domain-containing protein n=1 Tax=Batrachochytrium dendrobatidis (strain JAM81 / FGSC 10211) TaxID=684364 RepID=F4NSJ8_BATDJ|nr:uncharacterized protein BATDEDRAFT_33937 [Batrachochytrium dendrobatidis JAM81]EGF83034.1 hypothetical protein BATDEDRAFT_33937 [Batrachochytrium dendrobatidis JAM81]|eukprot:XP_006675696.1 hypothetical protein BATDEDRAFT_33937 [Batrachochytrium dendrobatidis JAM81]
MQRIAWIERLHTLQKKWILVVSQTIAHFLSTHLLLLLVSSAAWARIKKYFTAKHAKLAHSQYTGGDDFLSTVGTDNSTISQSSCKTLPVPKPQPCVQYYANHHGFDCHFHHTTTPDGFVLELFHITKQKSRSASTRLQSAGLDSNTTFLGSKGPVLLMHGLFQSAGVFVTSGPSSLAFHLVDAGFDVWLGNNRGSGGYHKHHDLSSLEFWDWSLEELARYDFPTLVEYVAVKTGKEKVTYIGHSQGNAQAFLGISINPKMAKRLRCFIALAPAVYTGPLLESGTTAALMGFPKVVFELIFGNMQFLPIMTFAQKYIPSSIFSTLAYSMFHHLFGWCDTKWELEHKSSYFQFSPRPTSTKAIQYWRQSSCRGYIGLFESADSSNCLLSSQSDVLDLTTVTCPLVAFFGKEDFIVDGDRFSKKCQEEQLNVLYSEHIDEYEHLDVIWAKTAPTIVFEKIVALVNALPVH